MSPNGVLRQKLDELGLSYAELAGRVNAEIQAITGNLGTVSERTVHNWISGHTQWPSSKIRLALECTLGHDAVSLGFVARQSKRNDSPEESTVQRRRFVAAAISAPVAAAVPAPNRVGLSDVRRLEARFAEIVASDHKHGGTLGVESLSVEMAAQARALQEQARASQRVRAALYGTAAAFMSSAMWAAIDGRRFEAAQRYFETASNLATLSGDSTITFRIWSHAGSMYRHKGRFSDALAANDIARSQRICRRDPMFASLGHARHAAILGLGADHNAVARTLGHAQDSLDRAEPGALRPMWLTAFYDQSELESLSLTANLALHDHAQAEAHAHRCLALLRPSNARSRAIATARLARAQLGQRELDLAVATAMSIEPEQVSHPRVAGMLSAFGQRLSEAAPRSEAEQAWRLHEAKTGRKAPG